MKIITTVIAFLVLSSFSVLGHEGHDHGAGQVQPTKGGVIQKAGNMYLEVVGTKEDLKVYPLREAGNGSKALKAVPLSELKVAATYTLPRGKATVVSFTNTGDHFTAKVAAGGAHRYQVDLKVESGTVKDEIQYQIEPQE